MFYAAQTQMETVKALLVHYYKVGRWLMLIMLRYEKRLCLVTIKKSMKHTSISGLNHCNSTKNEYNEMIEGVKLNEAH